MGRGRELLGPRTGSSTAPEVGRASAERRAGWRRGLGPAALALLALAAGHGRAARPALAPRALEGQDASILEVRDAAAFDPAALSGREATGEAQFLFDSAIETLLVDYEASRIADEVVLKLEAGGCVGLSTRGPYAFRVRFIMGEPGTAPPIHSPMVEPDGTDAPFRHFSGNGEGITAAFGAITLSPSGTLVLWKGAVGGAVLAETERLNLSAGSVAFQSIKASSSADGAAPPQAKVYGGGASPKDADRLRRQRSDAAVYNTATYAPQYYHSNGYAALGVVNATGGYKLPVSWAVHGETVRWSFSNASASFESAAPSGNALLLWRNTGEDFARLPPAPATPATPFSRQCFLRFRKAGALLWGARAAPQPLARAGICALCRPSFCLLFAIQRVGPLTGPWVNAKETALVSTRDQWPRQLARSRAMAPAGRALAVLALGAVAPSGQRPLGTIGVAMAGKGCGLSGSSALAAEPCNGEEARLSGVAFGGVAFGLGSRGGGDGFGGRCPYLVDGAWAAGARWTGQCRFAERAGEMTVRLHGSACFMAVQSDQCAANTFDEATCDDLHSDAAVCACEGLLAPPAAAGTTEAVSDGTADRPFCSWRSQCTWDAAAMAECATALCQAGGFAAGVFVSASNDPCTMSFAPNTGSDWFWLLDDDEVKYTLAKMDAQVTACCGSATTTVISTAMTPAPTNAPTSAPTSAPTNAPTTTTFISTEVTPAPTNGPFTTTAMTPVPTPAPTTTEMTPSPTSAPVATPAPTPDSNVFITTTRASTTQELGTEPVDQTTETVTSLTDTPVSVTAATSTALGGTTILDPDASASTETTTVGRTYSTTYGLQSSTTLDPIATATLSTMGSTVTTTPTTTQTLKCYDAPSVLHAPDTGTCAGTPDGSACDVQCGDGYVMTGVAACRGGAWDVTGRCVPSGTQATTLSVAEVIMRLSASNGYEWATEHQAEIEAAIEATLGTLDFLVDIFPVSSRRLTGGSQDISQADEFDIVVTVVVEGAAGGEEQAAYDIWSSLAGGFVGSLTSVLDSAGEPVPGGLRLETIGEPVVIPEYEMPLKSWIAGAWGSCSATCGQGTEARDVFCSVGVQSTCERAGVGPMLAAARECEQFVQCSFDLLCPLGRDTSLGCGAQLALIVACVALAGLCVLACACARLYAMSRVSATGHVSMLGGIQAKYTIEKRRQQQQLQQGNQPDLEHGSVSLKADGGKTHIVWEVDMDKVQEVLSPSASVVDPLGAHSPAARRRGSGLLRKWSRVSGGSMSHTPSRASGGSGDEELARRMRHWLSEQERWTRTSWTTASRPRCCRPGAPP
ncbi:unnamed protein product [Prorocentrum cordatum]|uniref:Uncharacterized protein n=1 Tax=Prorocentrum cordatum TaxID=2364126 RepID=A0ABN9ULH9_9DINO|nr:unnamed protein product [Polarella glacialis]